MLSLYRYIRGSRGCISVMEFNQFAVPQEDSECNIQADEKETIESSIESTSSTKRNLAAIHAGDT